MSHRTRIPIPIAQEEPCRTSHDVTAVAVPSAPSRSPPPVPWPPPRAGAEPGQVYAWDVVDEAFNEDGSMRGSLWQNKLGTGHIANALRWAHAADPSASLFRRARAVCGGARSAGTCTSVPADLPAVQRAARPSGGPGQSCWAPAGSERSRMVDAVLVPKP
jgi:hypothetical protein